MVQRFWLIFLFPVLGFLLAPAAMAQDAPPPVYQTAADIPYTVFAQLPKIEDVSISPNGRFLAVIYPIQGEAKLTIFDLSKDQPEPARVIETGELEVNWVQWLNNDRILLNYSIFVEFNKKTKIPQQRMMAFDRYGGNAIHIVKSGRGSLTNNNRILNYLADDPDHILMQFNSLWGADLGVYKMNINTGDLNQVQKPQGGSYYYFADHKGVLKIGWGYWKKHFSVFTKKAGDLKWKEFRDHSLLREEDFDPLTFAPDGNTLLVQMGHETDTQAIYEFDLETATLGEMLYMNPDYDVEGVTISPKTGELLAALYTEDYPSRYYFSDQYKNTIGRIEKALQGMELKILDSTPDQKFFIIRSYTANDPGMLYIYDDVEMELSPIWEVMDGLDPSYLSEVKKVTYKARDGLEISGYLTIPKYSNGNNLPTVLLVHGGPWARDKMVFNPEVQFLASRGYAVFQPNFRGSTGFGKVFEEMGYGRWMYEMQDDLTDARAWLIDQGITDPDRICIAGGSYGGYASLLAVARLPDLYQCAFAFAPVTDVYYLMQSRRRDDSHDFYKKTMTAGLKPTTYN